MYIIGRDLIDVEQITIFPNTREVNTLSLNGVLQKKSSHLLNKCPIMHGGLTCPFFSDM
jgi:hypothetical protein